MLSMDIAGVLLPLLTLHDLGPHSDKNRGKINATGAQGQLYRVESSQTKLALLILLSLSYVIHHREDSVTLQLNKQTSKGKKPEICIVM